MIRNFLITSYRALRNNKGYALLNISGLALGICCFILIAHYVYDELTYDRWNPNASRIYRVDGDIKFGGDEMHLAVSSDPMGPTLKSEYPQVEQYVRFYFGSNLLVKKGDQFIAENRAAFTDSTFLEVFPLQVLAGDAAHPLAGPNKVVLTESSARKYFGAIELAQIIGKNLETNDRNKFYQITAIVKDMPRNSHFIRDFFFSIQNVEYGWGNFLSNNFNTYILLRKDANPKEFTKNFKSLINKYLLPQAQSLIQIKDMEEFEQSGNKINYFLMPMTDIHLRSNRVAEMSVNGNIQYVYIFTVVALFIVLIACVNFMNLATAYSTTRAKEVGVRKVLGIEKSGLIYQFLSESTLMATLATVLGIVLAMVLVPKFNDLAAKTYLRSEFFKPGWLLIYLTLSMGIGFLAGIYPALYMSAFKPIAVLKGKMQGSFNKNALRSALVVFQFATSILLIIGSIVVYKQLRFIQTKNIGFQKDQVLVINGTGELGTQRAAFKNEINQMNGVVASTYAGYLPVANSSRNDNTFFKDAIPDAKRGLNMQNWTIDDEYIPLMGMQIIKGRNFSKTFGTDSLGVILNEEAVKIWGFEGDPINQKIYGFIDNTGRNLGAYTVIGVVKDFNFESLRKKVGALGFFYGKADWVTAFKVNASNTQQLLTQVEAKWKSMANGAPFSYRFLDDSFDEMYRAEQRVGKIAITFSIIAIFIACLGLFGLATFIADRRTKEIGIRKVLGADVAGIIGMLSVDFVKLVGIAGLIAFPFGYYLMHQWLQDYEYRIELRWWMFVAAGFSALFIAILTISYQAVRAALSNPVKSLRSE